MENMTGWNWFWLVVLFAIAPRTMSALALCGLAYAALVFAGVL